ncbi:hypothetical protein JG688_00007217 [Phytophthora aleatoria]|uniref:Uncharacterized protein n=1 Tax=Phytophthora aleatoria TaxID=2496075 RepID=A0A8J5IYP4_9STRA|nr:hypothetical protein JG688_00007217 [Phytophthora aleatoria]
MADNHSRFSLLSELLTANHSPPSQQRTPLTLSLIHRQQPSKNRRRITAKRSPHIEAARDLTPPLVNQQLAKQKSLSITQRSIVQGAG